MDVTFYIRPAKGKFIIPYVMIRIDRRRTKTAFSSEIKILESEWNEKTKTIRNAQRNLELQALKDRLYQIYNFHQFQGKYITAEEVKEIFMAERKARYLPDVAPTPETKITDLLNAFVAHKKKALDSNMIVLGTFQNLKSSLNIWQVFFENYPNLKPEELNRTHLEAYLATKGKTSTKKVQISFLKKVYQFAKSEKLIVGFEFPTYETEKVFFDVEPLEREVLDLILSCTLPIVENVGNRTTPTSEKDDWQGRALDLFRLQIFTGFSWIDTQTFEPEKHIKQINKKPFICKERQKNKRKTRRKSVVPIFEETRELLDKYGGNFPKIDYVVYKKALKEISILLKISKLVSHKARKTATYYLTSVKGYARDLVRIMLGHSSDAMADQHYFDGEKYLESKL